jgi:hypothetical protein
MNVQVTRKKCKNMTVQISAAARNRRVNAGKLDIENCLESHDHPPST